MCPEFRHHVETESEHKRGVVETAYFRRQPPTTCRSEHSSIMTSFIDHNNDISKIYNCCELDNTFDVDIFSINTSYFKIIIPTTTYKH